MSDAIIILAPHPREGIEGNPATCIGGGQPAVLAHGRWTCSSCGITTEKPDAKKWDRSNYGDYLKSDEWRERAANARRRADGRCWTCDFAGTLEVHHRSYEHVGQEVPDDLIALCSPCHTAVHLVADARRGVVRTESKRAQWVG